MSNFTPLTGQQLLNTAVQAYNSEAAVPANTGEGSSAGALFEATTLLALQLQQQIAYLFAVSRLATSLGPDVDSFVTPFGIARNGSVFASGQVTFTYPAGNSQTILVGSSVQTQGGVIFQVVADPQGITGNYYANLNGYLINTSGNVLVQCTQSGLLGNVLANTITLPYGGYPPIPGSPTITNQLAFTNGLASETDTALMLRFAQYISGGGEGTVNSIIAAAAATATNITFSYGDQWMSQLVGGNWVLTPETPGWFTIVAAVANSGSTTGAAAVCTAINNAIEYAVRPAGIMYNVIPPTIVTVQGAGQVVVQPGFSAPVVVAAVQQAFTNLVNGLGLNQYGASTIISIGQVYAALMAVPGVLRIEGVTLNGYAVDITANFGAMLSASPIVTGFSN